MEFEVKERIDRPLMRIVHAYAKNPNRYTTIYLDNETEKPLYPITIKFTIPSIIITIDSDFNATCLVPPSIPDNMIDEMIAYLKTFHDTVLAVRKLIKEEQQLFKNTHNTSL